MINPFINNSNSKLSVQEEDLVIKLSTDSTLEAIFKPAFWISIKNEYPLLSQKALQILLPFSSTYLCKTEIPVMTALKSKQRNRLHFSLDAYSYMRPGTFTFNTTKAGFISQTITKTEIPLNLKFYFVTEMYFFMDCINKKL